MSEEDMAPGKSSVAVNNCIRQLSYHKHNLDDTAGIWGEVRGDLLSPVHTVNSYCNNVDICLLFLISETFQSFVKCLVVIIIVKKMLRCFDSSSNWSHVK